MASPKESPGARLQSLWQRLSPLPGGRWLFSRLLGWMVPYSSSIGATVEDFEPGRVTVSLRDRRAVRNHLGSIHAIALANLGELATGLALIGGLRPDVRGILVELEVTYVKKARGKLLADAECVLPRVTDDMDYQVVAKIHDKTEDVVAVVTASWRLSPRRAKP